MLGRRALHTVEALVNGHSQNWACKIQSLYMEVEKNGFLKVAVIRTVCLQECLLGELQ